MQAVALASVVWSALRVGSNTEAFLSGSSAAGTAGARLPPYADAEPDQWHWVLCNAQ